MKKIFLLTVLFGSLFWGCGSMRKVNLENEQSNIVPPKPKNNVTFEYPYEAIKKGLEGEIELRLAISKQGSVTGVDIVNSSSHKVLDSAAKTFAEQMQFFPAMLDGKPIAIRFTWKLNYILADKYSTDKEDAYLQSVFDLYDQINSTQDKQYRQKLQSRLLTDHDNFYRNCIDKIDINKYIKNVVLETTLLQWQDMWQHYPLRFVVFDDFLRRFPDSPTRETAETFMLRYAAEDMAFIKATAMTDPGQAQKFIQKIQSFISENYPDLAAKHAKLNI
ncbi:energy transducer TonB [candidate division KSB1 bacterium]|nr:energy transducer TonB [candidate division KSB1 bacterium]